METTSLVQAAKQLLRVSLGAYLNEQMPTSSELFAKKHAFSASLGA
jgi:hypothetical protein